MYNMKFITSNRTSIAWIVYTLCAASCKIKCVGHIL